MFENCLKKICLTQIKFYIQISLFYTEQKLLGLNNIYWIQLNYLLIYFQLNQYLVQVNIPLT